MAHKFQPADEKYWAEQKIKRDQAQLRHKIATAPKTTFNDLFEIEDEQTATTPHQGISNTR